MHIKEKEKQAHKPKPIDIIGKKKEVGGLDRALDIVI